MQLMKRWFWFVSSGNIDPQINSKSPGSPRAAHIWLAGIVVLATITRFYGLGAPLWFDEIVTLVITLDGSLFDTISNYRSTNNPCLSG